MRACEFALEVSAGRREGVLFYRAPDRRGVLLLLLRVCARPDRGLSALDSEARQLPLSLTANLDARTLSLLACLALALRFGKATLGEIESERERERESE